MHSDTSSVIYPEVKGWFGSCQGKYVLKVKELYRHSFANHPFTHTHLYSASMCSTFSIAHSYMLTNETAARPPSTLRHADWGRLGLNRFTCPRPSPPRGPSFFEHLRVYISQRDWPVNLLLPTSMVQHCAFHPHFKRSSTTSSFLARFLSVASSICSSHGAVSCSVATCLDGSDSISGPSVVKVMDSGSWR